MVTLGLKFSLFILLEYKLLLKQERGVKLFQPINHPSILIRWRVHLNPPTKQKLLWSI